MGVEQVHWVHQDIAGRRTGVYIFGNPEKEQKADLLEHLFTDTCPWSKINNNQEEQCRKHMMKHQKDRTMICVKSFQGMSALLLKLWAEHARPA